MLREPVQVTDYRLEGRGGATHLRVVTSGMPAGADWDDLVEGTRLGWKFELLQLRHYLERHDGENRRARFVRRRVSLPRAEVWARLVVESGTVEFVFEDMPADARTIEAGDHQVVPPVRRHHITPDEDATFYLEFHRAPHDSADPEPPW